MNCVVHKIDPQRRKTYRGFNLLIGKVNPIHILFAPYDHLEWVQNVGVRPLHSIIQILLENVRIYSHFICKINLLFFSKCVDFLVWMSCVTEADFCKYVSRIWKWSKKYIFSTTMNQEESLDTFILLLHSNSLNLT